MIEHFEQYYAKAKMMQELRYEGANWTEQDIDDPLIWNVPIYDVVNRRYAAFSSLPEAVVRGNYDPKGNGQFFNEANLHMTRVNLIGMCYLFRLCGSGINYQPKVEGQMPTGSHGFGNFWVVQELLEGRYTYEEWIDTIPDKSFCDVKGYLLPMIKGGLAKFIREYGEEFIEFLINLVMFNGKKGIKIVVDQANEWLLSRGFKRQNFVLTAFAMDMAEYLPNYVDRDSDVYLGTGAKKCLKMILPKMKGDEAMRLLCDMTGGHSKPYDMEDIACDFTRYYSNFQSPQHVAANNNIKYNNNVCK